MNATAREIVESFQKTESAEETALALARKYGREEADSLAETRRILDRLTGEGYLDRRQDIFPPRLPGLRRLHLNLTESCNLACAHCQGGCSPAGRAQLDTALIFDLIDQAQALGAADLTLSGGEPLLHPGLEDILRRTAGRFQVQVATNGTLIDEAWTALFAEIPVAIQISLDGPTAEIHDAVRGPGTFARTIEAIRRLRQAGIAGRLTLAVTLMESNLETVERLTSLAGEWDIPIIRFLPLRRAGRARIAWPSLEPQPTGERVERFYDRVRRGDFDGTPGVRISSGLSGFVPFPAEDGGGTEAWCPVGTGLLVEAGGDVFPCSLLSREEFRLGNAQRQPLSAILDSPEAKGIVGTLYARRSAIESCAACLWKNLCQGGCMGMAFDRRGTVWAPDDFCAYRKKIYAEAFEKILNSPAPSGSPDARN